ncbi:TonB-dependent heme/hemoglobin receptor family protein [Methylophaga frappieri]|uniref:TonB-dependent heme/hemoglobin receptor family protein n=2 Tax=Methylophaga frappieri (strain ATCC BAA-2434 / DSM 25690 / JAM7) TaxID=754477 RepID=I1YFA4_METFJ|nr:TonB-dependent heme/hemoglobin receptor family protein [Methylophaga frappieri]
MAAQTALAESVELGRIQVTGNTITPELNSVDAAQIEKLQANDLEDLFSQSPEVTVSGGADIGQKLYIRGVEDQLLNITIDGAQQATRLFHHAGRISIEPELLKQVEVNAGAGNALSGPGALGGSVKFVTKDPEDMLRPGEDFGGLVKGMFSSNTDSFKTNTSLFGRLTDDWSAMVSYTQADFDNYEDGDGNEVEGTRTDQDYLFAKVVGKLTESQTLRLSYEKREDEGNRLQRANWGVITPRNMLAPIDSERETVTLNYNLNPIDNPYLDLSLTVYNTETDLTQTTARFGTFVGSGESKGFDLRNTSLVGMHKITYGVDYREDETVANGDGEDATDDSKVKGVYIQDDIQLTDDLLLSAGLRYDDYEFDNDFGNTSFDESEVSHNIGLNYHFTENWSAFASYAEAFKGPQAQDAFKVGFTSVDPNLKPEDAENVEFGVAYESRTWFGSAKVYQSNIDDVVLDNDYDQIFENIGDLESDGVILELGRRWDNLMARVSYHYNDAEIDGYDANAYDHAGIANMVRDTLITQLDYRLNSQWNFGWNARFVKGREGIKSPEVDLYEPGFEFDQPGYGIHDLYVQWQPAVSEDIRIGLTVRNVFDKNYLDHASVADLTHIPGYGLIRGYNEPGRDIRLSVAWQF